MAEGREQGSLSPLEEQILQEFDSNEDLDQQLFRERELATHKLWVAFQDSATAVAHLFRDCQQNAGLAAWEPFHESASAVTQLYRGASEVCKQCMDSGTKYGQKKKTKELITWAKKKRKLIRREELLAYLMDKPYQQQQALGLNPTTTNNDLAGLSPFSYQKPPPPSQGFLQGTCPANFNGPILSPRRRALLKDELPSSWSSDGDIYGISGKEGSGRKRIASSTSGSSIFDFNMLGPDCKRMRL